MEDQGVEPAEGDRPMDGSDRGPGPAKAPGRPMGLMAIVKPRVLLLLVFTGVASFVIASGPDPDLEVLAWLLVGGVISVAGANTINNVLDKNRDSLMERTMWRPIPSGRMDPKVGACIGAVLSALGLVVLWGRVNPTAAVLTLLGTLFYVIVYTIVLKPRTPENITLGGIAGAFPPLVGWMATRGQVMPWDIPLEHWAPPLLLGLIVVLWTPPHFWSLALFHREDYERAGIPMLPVVKGERETHRRIVAYTMLLVAASVAFLFCRGMETVYLVGVIVLDVPMVVLSVQLLRGGTMQVARRLFMYSNLYLGLLFLIMVVDSALVVIRS
jgi:protoheme IX farnesyltransferase